MNEIKFDLKTLTPLWTGGVDQSCDRLHETGLIGSLRWWYEVLVRGLGGYACDPTSEDRCPDKNGKHCVACELFGCTGWARKFRVRVVSTPTRANRVIASGQSIQIDIIPLRDIAEEEWCLFEATLRLISDYGAIGGKTIFKPSDERDRRDQFHHQDFGLVEIKPLQGDWRCSKTLDEINTYVQSGQWRSGKEHDDSWASLQHFWCVKGRYLARQDATMSAYNQVLGRRQDKSVKEKRNTHVIRWSDLLVDPKDDASRWLAGRQQESKKVFSFKHPSERGRTFGFVRPGTIDYEAMKQRLQAVWPDFKPDKFITGEQIIQNLFSPPSQETGGGAQ